MARIFISYRREDCPGHAGRLSDTLDARFGEENVFMDVDTIELGIDFVARIEQAIGDCDVVLALIGDRWLTVDRADGTRRIDQPEDFVRLEIATALARDDVRVIPVLVEGAGMPPAADLPENLAGLARRNGIALTDTQWRSDTGVLIKAIERIIGPLATPAAAAAAPPARAAPAAATPARRKGLRSFLWLVPALLSVGGVTLIYFGAQAHVRSWLVVGALYISPAVLLLLSDASDELTFPWIVAWGASLLHVVVARPRYVESRAAREGAAR